jgi:hypothetical protein
MPPKMVSASGWTDLTSAASSTAPWQCAIQWMSKPYTGACSRSSSWRTLISGYLSISAATFTIFTSRPSSARRCFMENQPIGYIS